MPPPRVDTVGSDCSHISVRGALPVYTFVEGIYALGEPENGRPTWRSTDGQSVIAWSTAKQGDEYFGAGTGAVWGILNAHKHRYLVKGTEARNPLARRQALVEERAGHGGRAAPRQRRRRHRRRRSTERCSTVLEPRVCV